MKKGSHDSYPLLERDPLAVRHVVSPAARGRWGHGPIYHSEETGRERGIAAVTPALRNYAVATSSTAARSPSRRPFKPGRNEIVTLPLSTEIP